MTYRGWPGPPVDENGVLIDSTGAMIADIRSDSTFKLSFRDGNQQTREYDGKRCVFVRYHKAGKELPFDGFKGNLPTHGFFYGKSYFGDCPEKGTVWVNFADFWIPLDFFNGDHPTISENTVEKDEDGLWRFLSDSSSEEE